MTWNQNKQIDFMHGMAGNLKYTEVHQNHAHLYGNYEVPVFHAVGLNLVIAGDTDFRTYYYLWLPKNLDNTAVKVYVRASIVATSGGGASANKGLVKLNETTSGAGDAAEIAQGTGDCTELANPFSTIDLTPTGSADGREFTLTAKVVNAGDTMTIHSIYGVVAGTGSISTTGIGLSGFRTTEAAQVYAADYPIATEHISALINGPKQIAKDRTASVFTYLGDAYRTARLNTTETSFTLVDRGALPIPDDHGTGRNFKIYAHLAGDGGATPHCRVQLQGEAAIDLSGTGWQTATFEVNNGAFDSDKLIPYEIFMKRAGGSRAKLNTLQIFRSA